jgi:Flp pilus assembly protein TadD
MASVSLRQIAASTLFLAVLGLMTHGLVVKNGYVLDAVHIVEMNPLVAADASLRDIFSSPYWDEEAHPGRGLYRPIAILSYQLTRRIVDAPVVAIEHAIDLGLHLACSLVLVIFLVQMGARFGVALILATLFFLHPVQLETIASLVGRSDLLATLFALLAICLSLSRRIPLLALWPGLFVLFLLSLLSKESTAGLIVLLPACWVARELWRGAGVARVWRRGLMQAFCLSLAAAGYLVMRQAALGDLLVSEMPLFNDGASGFFELRWRALAYGSLFVQKLVWPLPLQPDYLTGVVPVSGTGLNVRAALTGLAMSASVAWPVWTWMRKRSLDRVQLGIVLLWIAMSPVSNLVVQIGTPFAERFLYFPLFFLLLAAIDLPLWQRAEVANLGSIPKFWPAWAVVLIGLGVLSAMRIPEWKTNRTLFHAAAQDCPDNYTAQFTYGSILYREGRPEDIEPARRAFREAARIIPGAYTPRVALAAMAQMVGNHVEARTRFEEAYARVADVTNEEHEVAALNLSRAYRALEEFDKMESLMVPLSQEHPEWDILQAELADYWMQRGRIADALIIFERALERKPNDAGITRYVIWAHLKLGQAEQARRCIEAAPSGTMTSEFEQQLENEGLALPTRTP